jgi:hypothetical protein
LPPEERLSGTNLQAWLGDVEGEWLPVPSPEGLIVLKRLDSPRLEKLRGRMWIAGEIGHQGELTDIINLIGNSRVSGELFFIADQLVKTLSFKLGDIYAATSDAPEDRIGEVACRSGLLSAEELQEALGECRDQERLGSYLVSHKLINSHELFSLLQHQIEEIFYSLLLVRNGQFYFYREDLPEGMGAPLILSTQNMLFEGMQRIDELSYFRTKIPSAKMVFERVRTGGSPVPLTETEVQVLDLIDGQRDLEAIGGLMRCSEFVVTKAAFRMLQSGLIRSREPDRLGVVGRTARSSGCLDVITVFNETFGRVFKVATAQGQQGGLVQALSSFFEANTTYKELFAGVRLGPDGTFDTKRMCDNLASLHAKDKTGFVYEALNEFLSFELFVVGEALDEKELDALHEQLAKIFDVSEAEKSRPSDAGSGFGDDGAMI